MDTKLNINSIEAGSITYDKFNQDVVDKFNNKADSASVTNVSNRVTAIEELIATDSDAVIDKWDEVVTFLDGISATDNLEGILANKANTSTVNDLLDGKLDRTGGIITGKITIRTQDFGNQLCLDVTNDNLNVIRFQKKGTNMGFLGFNSSDEPIYADKQGHYKNLLHEGNVGDYALKVDGSNAMKDGLQLLTMSSGSANVAVTEGLFIYRGPSSGGTDVGLPDNYINVFNVGGTNAYSNLQLAWRREYLNPTLYARIGESSASSVWKTIAFTDSDITGNAATATKVSNVLKFGSKTFDGSSEQTITATDLGVTSSTVSDWGFTKNAGTVTNIATGTGLTGGPITETGTISLNSTYQTYCTNGNAAWASYTTATSIASIPVGYKLVKCTISAAGSFALESTSITAGREIHIIIYNSSSSDVVVSLPTASPYVNFSADSLTVPANKYAEINVISDGSNLYIRTLA